jgi:hypothetical protein
MSETRCQSNGKSQRELLEAFRRGERIQNEHTLTGFKNQPDECWHVNERTIVCATDSDGDDRDVVECSNCGRQRETACNFDEDMS